MNAIALASVLCVAQVGWTREFADQRQFYLEWTHFPDKQQYTAWYYFKVNPTDTEFAKHAVFWFEDEPEWVYYRIPESGLFRGRMNWDGSYERLTPPFRRKGRKAIRPEWFEAIDGLIFGCPDEELIDLPNPPPRAVEILGLVPVEPTEPTEPPPPPPPRIDIFE